MSNEPPNASAPYSLTLRFTYGTSAHQPVDDPYAWPHPNGPPLTNDETCALSAKLTYLHTVAADLKQQLGMTDDSGLVSLLEDEGTHAVRYAVPEALPAQIDAYLEAGAERLLEGDSKGAVAQLRTAEVLVRLVPGWGQAEMQAFVPGVAGLEKGETAAVVIETDVEIEPNGREEIERVTNWLEE
jgi:hypothetical protein